MNHRILIKPTGHIITLHTDRLNPREFGRIFKERVSRIEWSNEHQGYAVLTRDGMSHLWPCRFCQGYGYTPERLAISDEEDFFKHPRPASKCPRCRGVGGPLFKTRQEALNEEQDYFAEQLEKLETLVPNSYYHHKSKE